MGNEKKKKGEFKKGAHDSKGNIKSANTTAAVAPSVPKAADAGKDTPAKKK